MSGTDTESDSDRTLHTLTWTQGWGQLRLPGQLTQLIMQGILQLVEKLVLYSTDVFKKIFNEVHDQYQQVHMTEENNQLSATLTMKILEAGN